MADLFPYQAVGRDFLAARDRALLADDMGLGKSPQAITAATKIKAKRVVVLCPAIARVNWQREWAKWGEPVDLFIESFDMMQRHKKVRQHIRAMKPDVMIVDEAHYCKSTESRRTRYLYGPWCRGDGLVKHAARVWLLTGTPAPNHVGELFPHLRALWPDLLPAPGSQFAFTERYCHTQHGTYGTKVLGNKNVAELRQTLGSIMLRRKAEDVLKDLPPITWGNVVIEAPEALEAIKRVEADEEVVELAQALANDEVIEGDLAIATLRRLTGMAKVPAVAEMLHDELQANSYDKVIIFAHHKDVIARLAEALGKFGVVTITGATGSRARQDAIDNFQTDPAVRVFIGQTQACATAVTLTAANQVVFVEMSWTPADNAQAAKRAHRITQTRPVFVRTIGLAGSIDEAVTAVLERKSRQVTEILD